MTQQAGKSIIELSNHIFFFFLNHLTDYNSWLWERRKMEMKEVGTGRQKTAVCICKGLVYSRVKYNLFRLKVMNFAQNFKPLKDQVQGIIILLFIIILFSESKEPKATITTRLIRCPLFVFFFLSFVFFLKNWNANARFKRN